MNSLFDDASNIFNIAKDGAIACIINHGDVYHEALKYFNYGVFDGNETKATSQTSENTSFNCQ